MMAFGGFLLTGTAHAALAHVERGYKLAAKVLKSPVSTEVAGKQSLWFLLNQPPSEFGAAR